MRKVLLLWFLNLYDGMVTYWWISRGEIPLPNGDIIRAEEQNPLMKWALEEGVFLHFKLWFVSLLIIMLWTKRDEIVGYKGKMLDLTLWAYAALSMWHAYNFMRFL